VRHLIFPSSVGRLPELARVQPATANARRRIANGRRETAKKPPVGGLRQRVSAAQPSAPASARRPTRLPAPASEASGWPIFRARRTDDCLVLAFVDVDHLKEVNDGEGHLAGDRLLSEVASALRDGLRSYDLITRFGGDEFICTLSGVHIDEVKRRFGELAKRLAASSSEHSFTVGFAELQGDDDMQRLIARADDALLQIRRAR
jgi:diguanylate cyclase (GGDEF)-like protein